MRGCPQQRCTGNVACNCAVQPDDRAIANMNARENRDILPNPNVISDNGIPTKRKIGRRWRRLVPAAKNVERVGRHRVHLVVCPVHDEVHACCNLTEFSNDQAIPIEIVVMRDVFFEILITEISEFPTRIFGFLRVGFT